MFDFENAGAIISIIAGFLGIVFFVIRAFIRLSEKKNEITESVGDIYKDANEKYITLHKETAKEYVQTHKDIVKMMERNNSLIENNNKGFERLENAIVKLEDNTIKALLKSRGN